VADVEYQIPHFGKLALRTVAAAQPEGRPDHAIGAALVRDGHADADAVQDAFRRQIELTVGELVRWKDGEFAFNRDAEGEPEQGEVSVSVDPQAVLLEVFRKMDEAAREPAHAGAQP